MANGYELDYKKVHNTLGESHKNEYGEQVGQYITNLLAAETYSEEVYIPVEADKIYSFYSFIGDNESSD